MPGLRPAALSRRRRAAGVGTDARRRYAARIDRTVSSPPAPVKGRVPRGQREDHLLSVATEVFGASGFHGASLERVARAAGVSRQYVAKLFGDKEGLYVACHGRARGRLDGALAAAASPVDAAATEDDVRGVVRDVAAAYFGFVADEGASWDVLFAGGPGVAGPAADRIAEMRTRTIALLVALIEAAAPNADGASALLAADAMSGGAEQLARRLRREHQDPDELAERFVRFFWDGLDGLRSPPPV